MLSRLPKSWIGYDLGPRVVAFTTSREGFVAPDDVQSAGPYDDFNINPYCGDAPGHVAHCRQMLADALHVAPQDIVMPHQTHTCCVAQATSSGGLEHIDAVHTDQTGLCIGVSTADCIPVLLCDTRHHAVAAIHAGWRGTVGGIIGNTLDAMREAYGTRPADIRAAIGPGIHVDAFEVGDEVYEQFRSAGYAAFCQRREKWHIDLPACCASQLLQRGVVHVVNAAPCTYQNPRRFFSARRLTIHSGRLYTGIMVLSFA